MTRQQHVVVVDDEAGVRKALGRYLTGEGFRVSECADGSAMKACLAEGDVDVILLDLMLAGDDGLALARLVRQKSSVPIIMLTGKGDVIDRVAGLEAGADDYVAKPFHLREVLARIRTVLRRAPSGGPAADPGGTATSPAGRALRFGDWRLDLDSRELTRAGASIALTTGEFDLLAVLAQHPNRALTRDQLMTMLKGREWSSFDRAIDTQIRRLRVKLEDNAAEPSLIKTVRGAGYLFAGKVNPA